MVKYPPRGSRWIREGVEIGRPTVGLDIDGTIGVYHDHFITFAEAWLGKEIKRGYDGSVPLARWCGISRQRYRKVKLAYRQGGLKRSMPVYPGARELTVALRKAGAEVIICTTRPYLHLSNIEPDTRECLRRNKIQYDGIIMGENKYRDLKFRFGDRVVMVLDDLQELIVQASSLGLPAVVRSQPHNADFNWDHRVDDLEEAKMLGLQRIKEWEQEIR